jgi:acetyl-CoA synthetase (ADP-forming)
MKESLTEDRAEKLLREYGIPTPKEEVAYSEDNAVEIASKIGFPVALKLISPDIMHRSSANCILLNITSEEEVKKGYRKIVKNAKEYNAKAVITGVLVQKMVPQGKEVIVGMVREPKLGPAVLFGLSGIFVDILKDVSFRVAPVSKEEALKMIKEIKAYPILEGVRGEKPSDVNAIADVITKVSRLGMEREEIVEMDINPLFVYEKGAIAIDSKIILRK